MAISGLSGLSGLSGVAGGATPFNPATDPAWDAFYDLTLSSLYQARGGTTPATAANDPVGIWTDKSGNTNDAQQATAGARGIYQTNGIQFGTGRRLDINTPLSLSDDVTIYVVGRRTAGTEYWPLGDSGTGSRIGIDAAGTLRAADDNDEASLAFDPNGLFALKVTRAGNNDIMFTATGLALTDGNGGAAVAFALSLLGKNQTTASDSTARLLRVAVKGALLSAGLTAQVEAEIAASYPGATLP